MSHDDSVWSEGSVESASPSRHSTASGGSVASRGSGGSAGSAKSSSERSARAGAAVLDRASADMHCCTFRIGGQLFGLDVSAVGEVFQVERVVRVPLAPAGVVGLTNLRGAALAVVDLAAVLGLETARATTVRDGTGTVLVLRLQGMRFCAAIDQVESVFPLHSDQIRESAAIGEHPAIAGFLSLEGGRTVSVLDVEELTERIVRLRLRQAADGGPADAGSGGA